MYTYILEEDGKVKLSTDLYEWAAWYCSVDHQSLIVDRTDIKNKKGSVVATVETKFSGQVESLSAKPLVWVTQLVGNAKEIWRADSRKEAKSNHLRMVAMLERRLKRP